MGDFRKITEVVLDYINANGGWAGYKVEPVYYTGDLSNALTEQGRQREAQRACATWHQDNEVFAMLGFGGTSYDLLECAKKYQSPLIDVLRFRLDRATFEKYADVLYQPELLLLENHNRMLVKGLIRQGVLKKGAKVALFVNGEQEYFKRNAEKVLRPLIEATGAEVVATAAAPDHFNSPWDTYVLKYRNAGATAVVMDGGISVYMAAFLMRSAENQGWRPLYGMSSEQGLPLLVSLAPPAQLDRSRVVGHQTYDHGDGRPIPGNSTDATCQRVFADAKVEYSGVAPTFCSDLLLIKAAIDRSDAINAAAFRRGFESLGSSFPVIQAWATNFGPGDHQASSLAHDLRYSAGCSCYPVPSGAGHPIEQG